jgi:response regulator RpfG family c-di-GMP phosphodiesterase
MWKPRTYPYAKVLIANPNNWERRLAKDCLMMMKITSIFETDNNKDLAEAFWTNEFHLVVLDADLDTKTSADIIDILRAADALAPYIDRVMLCVPMANLRTLRIAQALKINIIVLKPYSIHTFCTHADDILSRTVGSLAQIKPVMPRRKPTPAHQEETSVVALDM